MNDNSKKLERRREMDKLMAWTAAYYERELTESHVEVYCMALDDYGMDEIRSAFKSHVLESKWFPKISELNDRLKAHTPQLESIADQQAGIVLNHIRRYGYTSLPVWEDPITARLFSQRFSYSELCNSLKESETKWFVKEFKEAYQSAHDFCGGDTRLLEAPDKNVMALIENIGG